MPNSSFTYRGFNYHFPQYRAYGNDNVVAEGQTIEVPRSKYFSFQTLSSSEFDFAAGSLEAKYADGSTSNSQILVPAFWSWSIPGPLPNGGDLVFPYYYNESIDYNRSNIYETVHLLDPSKELVSITLPNISTSSNTGGNDSPTFHTRLHIFSLSMWPAKTLKASTMPQLEIQYARSSTNWIPGLNRTQIFEVVVNNIGKDNWVLDESIQVVVDSPGVDTVLQGQIKRFRPGDQATVQVGVVNKKGIKPGTTGPATEILTGAGINASYTFEATYRVGEYEPTYKTIYTHESPSWYNNAKFGIFIHWGVCAVPAYGNVGKNETYAEWQVPNGKYFLLFSPGAVLILNLGIGGISIRDRIPLIRLMNIMRKPTDQMLSTTTSFRISLQIHGILRSGLIYLLNPERCISSRCPSTTMVMPFLTCQTLCQSELRCP